MDLKFIMELPSLLSKIGVNEAYLHFYIDSSFRIADDCYFFWSFELMMKKHPCFFITTELNSTLIDHTFLIRQNLGLSPLSLTSKLPYCQSFLTVVNLQCIFFHFQILRTSYLINKYMNIWDGRPPTF